MTDHELWNCSRTIRPFENVNKAVLQHNLIGFYNRDEKCLQRGTDWVFK